MQGEPLTLMANVADHLNIVWVNQNMMSQNWSKERESQLNLIHGVWVIAPMSFQIPL